MTHASDPLFDALSRLTPVAPRASHERRVRGQCHDVLAATRASREPIRAVSLVEVLSAAGVGAYVVAVITAAVRLLIAS